MPWLCQRAMSRKYQSGCTPRYDLGYSALIGARRVSEKKSRFSTLAEEGIKHLLWEGARFLFTWGVPFLLAGLTLASHYVSPSVPPAYLLAAAALVFGGTTTGILRFDEWRQRRMPQNKLKILPFTFAWDGQKDKRGRTTGVKGFVLTLNFSNRASFPLSVVVDEFDCVIEGHTSTNKNLLGTSMTLQAEGDGYFRDSIIQMNNFPLQNLEGKVKFKARYGRPGREKYEISDELKLLFTFDSSKTTYTMNLTIPPSNAAQMRAA